MNAFNIFGADQTLQQMSILLKDEILSLAGDNQVKLLGADYSIENFESCSYDLRIGAVFKSGEIFSKDSKPTETWNIEVKPSEIVTILTLEDVNLPKHIAATVFAINSLSSVGFLILNPGHIDPGYKGPVSICAINLSKSTIQLHSGKKIFTIIFERLSKDAEGFKKNLTYNNRLEREQAFYRDRASKLSNSFFDLIMENEYTPYLKELIRKGITERINFYLRWFIGGLVTISSILGGVYLILPAVDGDKKWEQQVDSLQQEIILKNDSIQYLKHRSDTVSSSPTDTTQKIK